MGLPGSKVCVPTPVQGTPLQVAEIFGPTGPVVPVALKFESEDMRPAGVYMEVVGDSADTEKALPYGPARVYRTCGIRWPPVEPIAPPNSTDSVSASASEKLEIAWPPRNPPKVP